MTEQVLLCSDLDRTLLPNGQQAESPQARKLLRTLAARPEVTLAYVSGRHRGLLQQAIEEYDLPQPDYAIGDVGTTIYETGNGEWRPWQDWHEEIAADWHGRTHADLQQCLAGVGQLRLQEASKQNVLKLSYYTPADIVPDELLEQVRERLVAEGVRTSLIWSVDEMNDVGLLDVLPEHATKLHAVEFLMLRKHFAAAQTVFAGDSGNDLPVLTSGLQSVLVGNARDDVREQAQQSVQQAGHPGSLYLARGGLLGMNGNYSAGVLEGLAHFLPHTRKWLEEAS
jgi:sucrose-6-phosphatase